jgi:hypothetical protein
VFAINHSNLNPTPYIGQTLYTFLGDQAALDPDGNLGLFAHSGTLIADSPQPGLPFVYFFNLTDGQIMIGKQSTGMLDLGVIGGTKVEVASLELVPESSTALLIALGSLGFLRRRRI